MIERVFFFLILRAKYLLQLLDFYSATSLSQCCSPKSEDKLSILNNSTEYAGKSFLMNHET